MKTCEDFIEKLGRVLPDLASVQDLIKAGIYRTAQSAYSARCLNKCPPYFYFPCRGIVYPKNGVIEFVRGCLSKPGNEDDSK